MIDLEMVYTDRKWLDCLISEDNNECQASREAMFSEVELKAEID